MTFNGRAGFCWWGARPGANIEDGSSLIIHWSSGSHERSTNWANQYDIYFGEAPTGWGPGHAPLDSPYKSGPSTLCQMICEILLSALQPSNDR